MIGILLAAGFSKRFGETDKLQSKLPHGEWMAMAAAQYLVQVLPHTIAVVKHNDSPLAEALKAAGLQVVFCDKSANSMAESLVTAMHIVTETPSNGCLIALADMPFIQPHTIQAVADALVETQEIVIPTFQNQRGHPVAFAPQYYPALLNITGDNGAKAVVQQFADKVRYLPCDDAGVLQDIDTPAVLASYFLQKT